MGNLIATISSIKAYADSCANEYSAILSRADEILSRVEKMYYEVQSDADRLVQQIFRGRRLLDEIQLKVEKYQALMEDSAKEVERCDEQIEYVMSHPIKKVCIDDVGNEYMVEKVDEVALAVVERSQHQAQDIYQQYLNKYNDATSLMSDVSLTITRFETIKQGIDAVAQTIQGDIYEIKKYINACANESDYNLKTLQGVIESITTYLASKSIFLPV